MPIKIPLGLPGRMVLENEHIPIILEDEALRQDIRPLQILILNLMPDKISTETQLLRAIGSTPLQVEITFLHPASHQSKNTAAEHLEAFYKTFNEIQGRKYDGLLVTGAPIEHLAYEQVRYWSELEQIMNWATTHVFSSMFLCWAAFAALYHYNGIPKRIATDKLSGIFLHQTSDPFLPLTRGFDSSFDVPVSRFSRLEAADLQNHPELRIHASSHETGVFLAEDPSQRRVFVLNHLEYEADTLRKEFERDRLLDPNAPPPRNYFPNDDPSLTPALTWRAHRTLLFSNWINLIYQGTPFDLDNL